MKNPEYRNLADLREDDRITEIGMAAIGLVKIVGFFVDKEGADGLEKANRYISKLRMRWPEINIIVMREYDKVPSTIFVQVGPPVPLNNADVPALIVPDGGSGRTWKKKTPMQIVADLKLAVNHIRVKLNLEPDSVELPQEQFDLLDSKVSYRSPANIGGDWQTLRDFLKRETGIFRFICRPEAKGAGLAGEDRALVYLDRCSLTIGKMYLDGI